MDDADLQRFLDELREGGGRVTTARRAIATAFLDAGGHVTVDDLASTVQAAHPEIAVSTVYRTMEALEERGLVEHLHLGHGPAVYHRSDELHHHLVCEGCGRVVEVPEETLTRFASEIAERFDFRIEARHFALPGWCATCLAAPEPPPA